MTNEKLGQWESCLERVVATCSTLKNAARALAMGGLPSQVTASFKTVDSARDAFLVAVDAEKSTFKKLLEDAAEQTEMPATGSAVPPARPKVLRPPPLPPVAAAAD
jgi:hypothetical protein